MIKLFEQYNEYNQVEKWLDKMGIENYTINDDLTVDVNGIVNLFNKGIQVIQVQFGIVTSSFSCSSNKLTSLKGCPKSVGGAFSCSNNRLTTLEYAPVEVGDDFFCTQNVITSLYGCPKSVGGYFNCSDNKLTSLKYLPNTIGDFDFYRNNIKTLKYAPKHIVGEFRGDGNPLPKEILDLHIDHNFLLDNQEEYGIWNDDDSFNLPRFNILLKDYFKDFKFSESDED